ncbi:hypothetical protein Pmani_035022 [Petrolisthes manimaculis]|uniref:Uncharacterized protein n=1 Tax=Petrolisthes manimaculis TaxID=1843537 RepID=A0AAE1TP30_9EUCA|nr:hypothetical protein Pmani_035022 [Petrolisthes manimaculis]
MYLFFSRHQQFRLPFVFESKKISVVEISSPAVGVGIEASQVRERQRDLSHSIFLWAPPSTHAHYHPPHTCPIFIISMGTTTVPSRSPLPYGPIPAPSSSSGHHRPLTLTITVPIPVPPPSFCSQCPIR